MSPHNTGNTLTDTTTSQSQTSIQRQRQFLGFQPIIAVAWFRSSGVRNWNVLYHAEAEIHAPITGNEYLGLEPDELDCFNWPKYDYDCEQINCWFEEELENDGGNFIKWSGICGMHRYDDDPLHLLRSKDTIMDDKGSMVDNYWEVQVLTRDDPEFWVYLLNNVSGAIGVDWQPDQEAFSKLVLAWARDNHLQAEKWLTAEPTPNNFVFDERLDAFIKQLRRAIRQGAIPLE